MPGLYPGSVVTVGTERSIDAESGRVDADVVREMIARGMTELTGDSKAEDAWRRFIQPFDVVGIKVNCSGAPAVMSTPEIVAEVVRSLQSIGVPAGNIWIYERFKDQMDSVGYHRFVPEGVHVHAVEVPTRSIRGYDPDTYVEVDFFGEEDTRSNLVRLVSERFTKIVNIPNLKDHSASGVTGCLKNIAYGNFSNVARSHRNTKTYTRTFIGTLASVEPLRSKTVLHIIDGLRGVWHGGPFVRDKRFVFYPKRLLLGTDPAAVDVVLRDVIEEKRQAEGALSVWKATQASINRDQKMQDPNRNLFIREPGHIEYAASLGLGIVDRARIRHKQIAL